MNFVLNLSDEFVKRVTSFYRDYQSDSNNESVLFFAKTEFVAVTVYSTNKVMFQGIDAEAEYNMWKVMLDYKDESQNKTKKVVKKPQFDTDYYLVSIGSDEVGTGDFFGPITVCAAYLDKNNLDYVKGLKIADSKKLTDDKILYLGDLLKDKIVFSLLTLHNEKFNDLTRRGYNMNKIKAFLHNKAIINLHQKIFEQPPVIVDQFAEEGLYFRYLSDETKIFKNIRFTTKAESKFASVAIASIIARYAFLKHFDLISNESGFKLLKGAGSKVDELASQILAKKGEAFLGQYAKMNFKTLDKAKKLLENI